MAALAALCVSACAPVPAPPPPLESAPVLQARYLGAFGGQGAQEGQFNKPAGIAFSSGGTLYVADAGNHRVQAFDLNGAFLRAYGRFGRDAGEMDQPVDVAVRRQARTLLYIAERGNARVQALDMRDERYWTLIQDDGSGSFEPSGVAVARAGDLYIANAAARSIMRVSPQGQIQWTRGMPLMALRMPSRLRVGLDGAAVVADPLGGRVARVDFAGSPMESWEDARIGAPAAAAVDAEGRWYVCDLRKKRIAALDPQGRLTGFFGEGVLSEPVGAAVSKKNVLYVADQGEHNVKRFQLLNRNRAKGLLP